MPQTAAQQLWAPYSTSDVDAAHDYLSQSYMELALRRISFPRGTFRLRTRFAYLGEVAISRAEYVARSRIVTAPFADPCFVHLLAGRYQVADGRNEFRARPGDAFMLLPDQVLDVGVEDFDLGTVTLPRRLLADLAEATTGLPGGELAFEAFRPLNRALERHWLDTIGYVHRVVLSDPRMAGNPLVAGRAGELLAAVALTVFPNTSMRAEPVPRQQSTPATIRRAVDFIHANSARNIGIREIATAARVGPRALQEAFRRHLDTTPLRYLRKIRMECADRDLRAADPTRGDTVAAIAARWGFPHPSRFAAYYQQLYGVAPSRTLQA